LRKLKELNELSVTHASAKRISGKTPYFDWRKDSFKISLHGEFSIFDLFELLLIVNLLEGNPMAVDRVLYRSI
jgi:hypothetical protein